jgi:hypothetical protein
VAKGIELPSPLPLLCSSSTLELDEAAVAGSAVAVFGTPCIPEDQPAYRLALWPESLAMGRKGRWQGLFMSSRVEFYRNDNRAQSTPAEVTACSRLSFFNVYGVSSTTNFPEQSPR